MSVKRRDKKKRILRDGETQEKNGRYRYTYYENGIQKCFYSWKLEKTDSLPSGKRDCESLREKEEELRRAKDKGITYHAREITVLELVEKYVKQKKGVKRSTVKNYNWLINHLKKDEFGKKRIYTIKLSDAKSWLIQLQENLTYYSIHCFFTVLRSAFQMAVDDDLLLKNPFNLKLSTILVNDKGTRSALTPQQEHDFLEFLKSDNHFSQYYDEICFLFQTGLRISEFCGLTPRDIDLEKHIITIDHQLICGLNGNLYIEVTKTSKGTRIIPLNDIAYNCIINILQNRKSSQTEPCIDGYTGFLRLTQLAQETRPLVAKDWANIFRHAVKKYNTSHEVPMPKITPHVCRHTYCSNMARLGMQAKTLQYLMGHSNISVTYDIYTHWGYEEAANEIKRLFS